MYEMPSAFQELYYSPTRGYGLRLGVLPGGADNKGTGSPHSDLSSTNNVTLVCPPVRYSVFVTV